MEQASIYGFGSFFNDKSKFNDIDVLIIHNDISYTSCKFSLLCKKYLLSRISNSHISILSRSGEAQHDFIKKCSAIFLGIVNENSYLENLDLIISNEINIRLH